MAYYHPFRVALLVPLLSWISSPQGATADLPSTEIQNLRVGVTPGKTRVVFDLSNPATYHMTVLNNPNQVMIEIQSSSSDLNYSKLDLRGTAITHIHADTQPASNLLYTFDITQGATPKLFTLQPYQGRGHRLVLDLYEQENSGETSAAVSPGLIASTNGASRTTTEPDTSPTSERKSTHARTTLVTENGPGEWSGYISIDSRLFFQSPAFPKQDKQNISAAFKPEYYLDWAKGRQQLSFSPFFRYDANDDERTHADIRELYWRVEQGPWAIKAGLDVVFWGVIESQHLVDIINQTDLVENIDGEEKLGQPMLNLDYASDWGAWQFYLLPYFRERTFPGERGRLRTQPVVDTNHPVYESGSEEKHIDLALRWSHYIGNWDIGVAHFSGTSREPLLIPSDRGRKPRLAPIYVQIEQTSLDVQATKGAWLWKLEAIYNQNDVDDYYAYASGFEYTHFGITDSGADLGWLLEYHYDERDGDYTTNLQSDVYAGLRYTGNDTAGTRLLAGVVFDTDNQSTFFNIEASRRLNESWVLMMDLRLFSNIDEDDLLFQVKDDSYVEVQLRRYF